MLAAGADPDSTAPLGLLGRTCIDALLGTNTPGEEHASRRVLRSLRALIEAGADVGRLRCMRTNELTEGLRTTTVVQTLVNPAPWILELPRAQRAAAVAANNEALGLLLDAGADPSHVATEENAREFWVPPLIFAVHSDNARAVELLLAAGAHPGVRVAYAASVSALFRGRISALDYAVMVPGDGARVLNLLLGAGATLAADAVYPHYVDKAARDAGSPDKVAALLAAGADAGVRGDCGGLPLVSALIAGSREATRLLLDAGGAQAAAAAFPCRTVSGPLLHAAVQGDAVEPGLVELLLEHPASAALARAQLNTSARYSAAKRTPLSIAAYKGHGAAVLELLKAGADAKLADSRGVLPVVQLRESAGKLRNRGAARRAAAAAALRALEVASAGAGAGGPVDAAEVSDGELNTMRDISMEPIVSGAAREGPARGDGLRAAMAATQERLQEQCLQQ